MDTYDSDNDHEEPEDHSNPLHEPEGDEIPIPFSEDAPPPIEHHVLPPHEPAIPPTTSTETYAYAQDEYPPSAPLEPINPWIGIVTQPRATTRYVLDSGKWNNIWALYAIIFVMMIPTMILSMIMQAPVQDLPPGMDETIMYAMVGGMLVGMLIFGYPMGMLMVYIFGYFYKLAGSWLDGVGTTSELRIAFTWSYVASMYLNLLMIIPYGLIAYYNFTSGPVDPTRQMLMSLVIMVISLPVTIIYMIIASKCIGEAHRFSAWRGLGTILISMLIWTAIVFGFVIGFVILVVGIVLLARFA